MKRDLTKGNVTASLLLFACPMILGNLLQQLYNIVDTWVVGRFVGADALAAVGSAYSLMTFLTSVLIGLCMGSGALLSYYSGRGDGRKLRSCMMSSFVLVGLISLGLNLLVFVMKDPILYLLRIPEELFDLMGRYVSIVFVGIFFVFLYNFFAFVLRAVGNSVVPLVFLGLASVMNVVLDVHFVLGLDAGLEGAAWATVAAQIFSGVGLGIYTWVKEPRFRFSLREFLAEEKPLREILRFSVVTSAQQSVMNFGILMIQGLVNSFGKSVMAAFAAAVKIDTFAYMPAQEFGNAVVISALVFGLAKYLMLIFVKKSEIQIIEIGMEYLRIEGAFYMGIGILFLLYGYFRGVNRPGVSLLLTVVSLGTRVLLAYVLAGIPKIGVHGIWWAIPIGWGLADAVGILLMRKAVTGTDLQTSA